MFIACTKDLHHAAHAQYNYTHTFLVPGLVFLEALSADPVYVRLRMDTAWAAGTGTPCSLHCFEFRLDMGRYAT